ncbi:MAG: VOC family protein [Longimicrobiales bacterium]|nr:VOC family protein [Longimicrobiales bacterium]
MSRGVDGPGAGGAARPTTALDHLVVAVPSLPDAVAWAEREWGCTVHAGGRHPAWGTWNALVPLVGGAYVELVAPDPDPDPAWSGTRPFGLDGVTRPRLATWAVRPEGAAGAGGIEALARGLEDAGVPVGAVGSGRRRRPDGSRLEWRLSDPSADRLGGTVPFLIDWGPSPHPSGIGPAEVRLRSLSVAHPRDPTLRAALAALGWESGAGGVVFPVEREVSHAGGLDGRLRTPPRTPLRGPALEAALEAVLETPGGRLTIG